jgi:hypothetical protein
MGTFFRFPKKCDFLCLERKVGGNVLKYFDILKY